MHPDHHNKIIIIVTVIIVVVVLLLGLAIVVHKKKKNVPVVTDTRTEYERYVDSTSSEESSSINDPEVVELNVSTSASGSSNAASRGAMIEATSGSN